ncbi:MAG: hypothetical protein V1692_02475 [bacterium]
MTSHEQNVQEAFGRLCAVFKMPGLNLRFMNPERKVNTKSAYTQGSAILSRNLITVDIYTPRFRKPKSLNGIIRILAHEIAHYQKPPYRQRYRGHLIARQHYPAFYRQVTRNIDKIKRDPILKQFFKN